MTNESAPKKKGLSTLAWVGIGCGGLLVVALVVFLVLGAFAVKKGKEFVDDMQENPAKTAAETIVRLNPDLDLVETDDEAGTITFVNRRTGEEATLNFDDIAEGKWSVTTDEGEYSIDASEAGEGGVTVSGPGSETRFGASADLEAVPDWVPMYPGATDMQSAFHSAGSDGKVMGAVNGKTRDDPQAVIDHFKEFFADGGWTLGGESMTTAGDAVYGGVNGTRDGRTINVGVTVQGGDTQVVINYNGTDD